MLLAALFAVSPQPAFAGAGRDASLIMRGVGKTVGSVFQLPITMLASSTTAFPFGLLGGAVLGTFKAVGGTLSGAFDIARGAAPYAKYAIFL